MLPQTWESRWSRVSQLHTHQVDFCHDPLIFMSISVSVLYWLGFHGSVVNFEFWYLITPAFFLLLRMALDIQGLFLHRLLCENKKEELSAFHLEVESWNNGKLPSYLWDFLSVLHNPSSQKWWHSLFSQEPPSSAQMSCFIPWLQNALWREHPMGNVQRNLGSPSPPTSHAGSS